jgi:hypothetical protein
VDPVSKLTRNRFRLPERVKDKTVTWQYNVDFNGSALTATYTGDWDGDLAITGAIDVQPANAAGTFTAKKDK